VKRKSFLGEKVLWKHVYGNVQMPYQTIMQLGHYKKQSGEFFSSSTLPTT
jgi:hypothetical protein